MGRGNPESEIGLLAAGVSGAREEIESAAGTPEAAPPPAAMPIDHLRVLIVDDNAINRRVLQRPFRPVWNG